LYGAGAAANQPAGLVSPLFAATPFVVALLFADLVHNVCQRRNPLRSHGVCLCRHPLNNLLLSQFFVTVSFQSAYEKTPNCQEQKSEI
jgi:hypothetical protein